MYIIDGHNLIPKIPGLSLKAIDDELELIELLKTFCRKNRKKILVFFDKAPPGQSRTQTYGCVTARFVMSGVTADRAILNHLKSQKNNARNLIVVTSDRQVKAGAHAYHAGVLSSESFAARLTGHSSPQTAPFDDPGASAEPVLGEEEIDDWLAIFNESQHTDE